MDPVRLAGKVNQVYKPQRDPEISISTRDSVDIGGKTPEELPVDMKKIRLLSGEISQREAKYDGIIEIETALNTTPKVATTADIKNWEKLKGKPVLVNNDKATITACVVCSFDVKENETLVLVRLPEGEKQWFTSNIITCPESKPARKILQNMKNPEIRDDFLEFRRKYPSNFPCLTDENWEAISPVNWSYNCIAHTIGATKREKLHLKGLMPIAGSFALRQTIDDSGWKWPKSNKVEDFDRFYADKGFVPLDKLDYELLEGIEKVVLFGVSPNDTTTYSLTRYLIYKQEPDFKEGLRCTHAIVQDEDGTFSSKNGRFHTVRVLNPDDLGAGTFGRPIRVYARPHIKQRKIVYES